MIRRNGLVRCIALLLAVFLLSAGCGDGRQALLPSASPTSRPVAEQPNVSAAPSAASSGGGQTSAAPVTPSETFQSQVSALEGTACDLLTKEEVEGIVGRRIDTVEVQPGYGNCIYYTREKVFSEMMNLPVVTIGYSRSEVQARWDHWTSRPDKEVITGVGDEAIWSPDLGFFVCRVKGGLLMISVGGIDNAGNKNKAVNLAKKAIGRIQS